MEAKELKSAIENALDQVERYSVNSNYQVAVYSDGTTSGLLERNTWEGDLASGVFEVCRVQAWFDKSQSDNKNKIARREEKKFAFESGLSRLNEMSDVVN
jgi:hypothetical protein